MTQTRINVNADLGEFFGSWAMRRDGEMLERVDSANIACSFDAGDPVVMRQVVATARRHGVSTGAQPGFPDLLGLCRRRIDMAPAEVEAIVVYLIGARQDIAAAEQHRDTHVKPHGTLDNLACENLDLARCIARAVRAVGPDLILLAPALSALVRAAGEAGLGAVEENSPTGSTPTMAIWCRVRIRKPWCRAPRPASAMSWPTSTARR